MEGKTLARTTAGPNYAAATVGNVVLVQWRDRPSKASVLRIDGVIQALLRDYPGKIGFLVFVRSDSPPPDSEARDEFANSMRRNAARISGSTLVIEGTGLRAAASRAVLTAITLLGDVNPVPKVCATVEEAADILARFVHEPNGPGLTAADIVAGIKKLRDFQAPPASV